MFVFGNKITNDYGWELALLGKIRNFSDGITFFTININWDRYLSDHSPKFTFHIELINCTLIEFNIYYMHHRD